MRAVQKLLEGVLGSWQPQGASGPVSLVPNNLAIWDRWSHQIQQALLGNPRAP